MAKTPIFKQGDSVYIKHDRGLGQHTVINPCDPTDAVRMDGAPVEFYVRLHVNGNILGYHQENLEKVSS